MDWLNGAGWLSGEQAQQSQASMHGEWGVGMKKRWSRSLITTLLLLSTGCVNVIDEPLPEPTFRSAQSNEGLPDAGDKTEREPEDRRDDDGSASLERNEPPAGPAESPSEGLMPSEGNRTDSDSPASSPAGPVAAGAAQSEESSNDAMEAEGPSDGGMKSPPAPDADPPEPMAANPAVEVLKDAKPSPGCGDTASPAGGTKLIKVDGVQREFIIQLPQNYDPTRPYRLVFAWHDIGETAALVARDWYGLGELAEDKAIFIAGQGLSDNNRNGGLASWTTQPDESDMDYTRAMLGWAVDQYCIDTARIFSIGASNGGMMSNIVGCELGETIRGIAVMAGIGPQFVATAPCLGQVAVWIAHGNLDTTVPLSEGQISRNFWTRDNSCTQETLPGDPPLCLEYQGCDAPYPVQFCEFDGGHEIPDFAAEAAWRFFERL